MHEVIIEPGKSRRYWQDLWRFRELFFFLAWRDILVRYKQTTLGVAWAVLQPLVTMVAFTVVFGRIARLPSDGLPYPVLVLAGLLPWQLFSHSVTAASNSLVGNANLISKLYFQRLIVPASAIIPGLVDLIVSAAILAILMGFFGVTPSWRIVTLPFFLLLAVGAALAVGIGMAALTVRYRDFRYIVPFMLQAGLYISPVGFSSSVVPEKWRLLYSLNPMVSIIDGFRWSTVGGDAVLQPFAIAAGTVTTSLALGVALWYFRSTERTFADVI